MASFMNDSQIRNLLLFNVDEEKQPEGPGAEHVVLASTLALTMLLTIFGNIALIITIYRTSRLRTLTNRFILNLACADVGVGLFCMPFSVVTCYTRDWIFGDRMCQLNGFMNILFSVSSLFTLTAISIEKYFSIVKPMSVVITKKRAWVMIAMTWIAGLCFAIIPLTGFIGFDFKTGSTQCGVQVPSTLAQAVYAYLVFAVFFLIPLGIMGFCYMNIFRAARNHDRRINRMSFHSSDSDVSLSSQNQIAATVFILLVVFIVCWTPYFVYMVYMTAHKIKTPDEHLQSLGLASYWCIFLNSCVNPLVYGVRNPLIRRELSSFCCQRYQHGQRHRCLQWTCARKRERNALCSSDPYLASTNAGLHCDKTSPAYPSYTNVVALTVEDTSNSSEDISQPNMDKSTQTGQAFLILSVHDLCHAYERKMTENNPPSTGFSTVPVLLHDVDTDSATEVTCSCASTNTCSRDDVSSAEEVTCSSGESETDSSCSDCELGSDSASTDSCSCEDSSISRSNSDRTASCTSEKYQTKICFKSSKRKTGKFKVGWMESQL